MDFINLSKIVSHALRHEPRHYGLVLDNEGWISIQTLIFALNNTGLKVDQKMLIEMVENSEKKRHQILENRIRAYYGHSTQKKIIKKNHFPPDILYHGTIASNIDNIMKIGLQPMKRQYVHLSIDEQTAIQVARRRKGEIIILKIQAKEASKNGTLFYPEENGVWLSEPIARNYIKL